jgi:hypothetical protein
VEHAFPEALGCPVVLAQYRFEVAHFAVAAPVAGAVKGDEVGGEFDACHIGFLSGEWRADSTTSDRNRLTYMVVIFYNESHTHEKDIPVTV